MSELSSTNRTLSQIRPFYLDLILIFFQITGWLDPMTSYRWWTRLTQSIRAEVAWTPTRCCVRATCNLTTVTATTTAPSVVARANYSKKNRPIHVRSLLQSAACHHDLVECFYVISLQVRVRTAIATQWFVVMDVSTRARHSSNSMASLPVAGHTSCARSAARRVQITSRTDRRTHVLPVLKGCL